jgi:hypothetical protein
VQGWWRYEFQVDDPVHHLARGYLYFTLREHAVSFGFVTLSTEGQCLRSSATGAAAAAPSLPNQYRHLSLDNIVRRRQWNKRMWFGYDVS